MNKRKLKVKDVPFTGKSTNPGTFSQGHSSIVLPLCLIPLAFRLSRRRNLSSTVLSRPCWQCIFYSVMFTLIHPHAYGFTNVSYSSDLPYQSVICRSNNFNHPTPVQEVLHLRLHTSLVNSIAPSRSIFLVRALWSLALLFSAPLSHSISLYTVHWQPGTRRPRSTLRSYPPR